jgi:hypothetical protein
MTSMQRALFGALIGGILSLLLLAFGLLRALVVVLSGRHISTDGVWPAILLYPIGFMVAGVFVGIAWPLQRRRFGRYLLGILGAGIVFAFIMRIISGPVVRWDGATYIAFAICTLIFGLVAGFQLRE